MKAAVIQAAPVAFDVDATLDKVERLAAEADADLVVFPEAFVSCYPRGLTFGAVVGSRTGEGRAWFRRYWESSIDVARRPSGWARSPASAAATSSSA